MLSTVVAPMSYMAPPMVPGFWQNHNISLTYESLPHALTP